MEVLNAVGVTPLTSLHKTSSDKRPEVPPCKRLVALSLKSNKSSSSSSSHKTHKPDLATFLSRGLQGGLTALSSVLGPSFAARALTYEEALQQGVNSSSSSSGASGGPDVGGFLDGFVRFGSENPLVLGGGALALAVPLILSQILGGNPNYGVRSAKVAYAGLEEDDGAQLLDIREGKDVKESGSPNLKSLKKKSVSIPYNREDNAVFLKKLSLRFKDPKNTTLYILDKFDGNSGSVAQLVTTNGFKAAYAVKGGAEGPRGWKDSGLPWTEPKKAISLDLGGFKAAFGEALGDGKDGLPAAVGLAAVAGLSVLAYSEMGTVLQLLGSTAVFQFATKKLLFAADRKVTLGELDEFLNTKIAPKEVADEIKMIGKSLLPESMSAEKSPPAEKKVEAVVDSPAEISPTLQENKPTPLSPYTAHPDFKPPSSPCPSQPAEISSPAEKKVEAAVDAPADISSTLKEHKPTPLSPYSTYPDFKPPSSPCPSQP